MHQSTRVGRGRSTCLLNDASSPAEIRDSADGAFRAQYWLDRVRLIQRWANRLDDLRAGGVPQRPAVSSKIVREQTASDAAAEVVDASMHLLHEGQTRRSV